MSFLDRRHQPAPDEHGDQPPTPPPAQGADQPAEQPAPVSSGRGGGSRRRVRVGVIGIVAALLVGLLLAPGAANAAFVVPPVPTPPAPTPTAPGANPQTPAPPSGRAPNDTLPAPSSPEAPASGPAAARQAPADALQALPFSTQPAAPNAVTCYLVVDKVTPTKPVSNVVGQGCHNGPRIPPLLNQLLPGGPGVTSPPAPGTAPAPTPAPTPAPAPRLRSDDGPNGVSAGAPDEAPAAQPQAAAVPLAEFYAGANYSGASFIIYGTGGDQDGCDNLGYRLPNISSQNSSIGGTSSYRTYNNCSNQAIHNQTDFGGTANFFTGYNRSSLPAGYDNAVRSARLASVPCTYYNETNASVCGVIRDKYNALGGPDGPLGFPTSNELTNPDRVGKRSTFQGATSIYWTPATGAHDVRGPLRDAWARNGWETGALGYPVSGQLGIVDNVGRVNRFFKNNTYAAGTATRTTGSIYWSPTTNAWAIHGSLWDKYSSLGGATGCHKYPLTDVRSTSVGPRTNFNGGWQDKSYIYENRGEVVSTCSNDPNEMPPRAMFVSESSAGSQPNAGQPSGFSRMQQQQPQPPPPGPVAKSLFRPVSAGCPTGSEEYGTDPRNNPGEPIRRWNCLAVYRDRLGEGGPALLREGVPAGPGERGFGRIKVDQKHGLNQQTIGAIIFNSPTIKRVPNPNDPDNVDYERTLVNADTGEPYLTYLIGVRLGPGTTDTPPPSPDTHPLGVNTGFCPPSGGLCPAWANAAVEAAFLD